MSVENSPALAGSRRSPMRTVRLPLLLLLTHAAIYGQTNSDLYSYSRSFRSFEGLLLQSRQLTFNRLPGVSLDYELSEGDSIEVQVVGVDYLTYQGTIGNDGTLRLPVIGGITAAGQTALQLEHMIAERLKEHELMPAAEVLVHITEYQGKPFYVIGQIDRPGEYSMSQHMTLMDAVLIAGGLDYGAADWGYLHRRPSREKLPTYMINTMLKNPTLPLPGTEVVKVDLRPLKNGGVLEEDVVLQKGDVFVVPPRPRSEFYVIGAVVSPGSYELPVGEDLYASQAIAQAGGLMKSAKTKGGVLIRFDEEEGRVERSVDFAQILKGKSDDFTVRRNDLIFVPGSNTKTLGVALLGAAPQSAAQSAQRGVRRSGGGS